MALVMLAFVWISDLRVDGDGEVGGVFIGAWNMLCLGSVWVRVMRRVGWEEGGESMDVVIEVMAPGRRRHQSLALN